MRGMWVPLLSTIITGANAETFSAVGAPVCGYGQYRQDDTCYNYGEKTSPCQGRKISGTSCLNQFIKTASEIDNLYPFDAGFSVMGSTVNTYANQRNTECLETMDGYYTINITQYSNF